MALWKYLCERLLILLAILFTCQVQVAAQPCGNSSQSGIEVVSSTVTLENTNLVNGSGFCFGDQQGSENIMCSPTGFTDANIATLSLHWFFNNGNAVASIAVTNMFPGFLEAVNHVSGGGELSILNFNASLTVTSVACRITGLSGDGFTLVTTAISSTENITVFSSVPAPNITDVTPYLDQVSVSVSRPSGLCTAFTVSTYQYTVYRSADNVVVVNTTSTDNPANLTGLVMETPYRLEVQAVVDVISNSMIASYSFNTTNNMNCTSPCQNGGNCTAPDTCTCPTEYTGLTCDQAICNSPCQNGGNCTTPDTCTCATGYSGNTCDQPICNSPCQNGGNCTAPDNCTCPTGYSGLMCEKQEPSFAYAGSSDAMLSELEPTLLNSVQAEATQSPSEVPSSNDAFSSYATSELEPTSVSSVQDEETQAPSGVEGNYSTTSLAPIMSPTPTVTVCQRQCVNGICNISECICNIGWTGDMCNVPNCEPGCENGRCSDQRRCICNRGWTGTACNEPVCTPMCVNGNCSSERVCDCFEGWTGISCKKELMPPNNIVVNGTVTSLQLIWDFLKDCEDVKFEVTQTHEQPIADGINNILFIHSRKTVATIEKRIVFPNLQSSSNYCFTLKGFCRKHFSGRSNKVCFRTADEPPYTENVMTAERLFDGSGDTILNNGITIAIEDSIKDSRSYFGEVLGHYITVQLTVLKSRRLLPFGKEYGDTIYERSTRYYYSYRYYGFTHTLKNSFPLFGEDQNLVYINSYGFVSFGRPYTNPWRRVPFPLTGGVPIVAAMWWWYPAKVYVHEYSKNSKKHSFDEAYLKLASTFLNQHEGIDRPFNVETVLAITWEVDYYYISYTVQMLLISDNVMTYALINYDDKTWSFPYWYSRYSYSRYGPIIGYSGGDGLNFKTLDEAYWKFPSIESSSGVIGSWLFPLFSQSDAVNSGRRCKAWYDQEKPLGRLDFVEQSSLNACPCTLAQARRNWRLGWAWGFQYSSREGCTILWRPRRQGWRWWRSREPVGTVECCYNDDGRLLVGPNSGGTSHRYHPYIEAAQYINNEFSPYYDCCVHSSSTKFCNYYFELRASDDCSQYDERTARFMGDPHFSSFDGLDYTFNGKGEFWLVQTTDSSVSIQVRLSPTDNGKATFITAAAISFNTTMAVNAYISETNNNTLMVNVGGHVFNADSIQNTTYFGFDGTEFDIDLSDFNSLGLLENVSFIVDKDNNSANGISISPQDNSLSVSIRIQAPGVLTVSTDLNGNGLQNKTRGLLGVLNADSSDDFTLPDGTILKDLNATNDSEVYNSFGQHWRVAQAGSLFTYGGSDSYASVNNAMGFLPQFGLDDSIVVPALVTASCGGSRQCLFDYQVTKNAALAESTNAEVKEVEEVRNMLVTPPSINGPSQIRVIAGQNVTAQYNSSGNLTLQSPSPAGVSLVDGVLSWGLPPTQVPAVNITILASVSSVNPTKTLTLYVVLCACMNGGECIEVISPNFEGTRYYREQCNCPPSYGGNLCEEDIDGCSQNPCQDPSLCEDISAPGVGFNCTGCLEGYQLSDNMCEDVDECSDSNLCQWHASCVNSQGSFLCVCESGFELSDQDCFDIDECNEGSAECEQMCVNTEGSFQCTCLKGFIQDPTFGNCTASNPCNLPCGVGTCVSMDGESHCVCPLGKMSYNNTACVDCPSNTFGFNCSLNCNCLNGGVCDSMTGCACTPPWTGSNCTERENNFAPEFISTLPTMITMSDRDTSGSVIATLSATDNDGDQIEFFTQPFSLSSSMYEDGRGFFSLNFSTGEVSVRNEPSGSGPYLLTVIATDDGKGARQSTPFYLVIQVNSRYEQVVALNVSEGDPVETDLGVLQCSVSTMNVSINYNTDIQKTFRFTETAPFSVSLISRVDFEQQQVYAFDIQCTEVDGRVIDASVRISVLDINDNDPILVFNSNLPSNQLTVRENNDIGEIVGRVTFSDADSSANGNISFLFDPPDVPIAINNKGEIVMSKVVNYEIEHSYPFTVTAIDGGAPMRSSTTLQFYLNVDNSDDPPVFDAPAYVAHMPDYSDDIVLPSSLLTLSVGDDDDDETSIIQLSANIPWLTITDGFQTISISDYPTDEHLRVGSNAYLTSLSISPFLDGPQNSSTGNSIFPLYLKASLTAESSSVAAAPLFLVVFPRDSLIKVVVTTTQDLTTFRSSAEKMASVFADSLKLHTLSLSSSTEEYSFELFTLSKDGSKINIYGYFHNSTQSGALTRRTLRHNYHFLTQNVVKNILADDYTRSQIASALGTRIDYTVEGAITTIESDAILPDWAIIVISVGGFLVLVTILLIGLCFGYFCRRCKRKTKAKVHIARSFEPDTVMLWEKEL